MNSNPLDQARTILNELRLAVDKNDVKGKSLLNRAKVSLLVRGHQSYPFFLLSPCLTLYLILVTLLPNSF